MGRRYEHESNLDHYVVRAGTPRFGKCSASWAVAAASALLLCAASPSVADVVRDGSIGAAGPGQVSTAIGPGGGIDYLIRESDGQLVGGVNLFHSFDQFDLTATERAIYQGSSGIQNLITRVTGGPSSIDGTIVSEIPGANLFFLNPAGVIFGENAQVDITGSFYVSTADRLLFHNGDVLETSLGTMPTLSVDTVEGFGFLDAPAAIQIQGSQIELAFDHDLGLIGGDIRVEGNRSDGQPGFVSARSGRMDLASLASSGEVYIDADIDNDDVGDGVFRVENVASRGDLSITGNTTLSTSGIDRNPFNVPPGEGSGDVNVYADDLLIEDADIRTLTVTDEDAGDVSIDLTGDLVVRSVPGGMQSGIIAGTGLELLPPPGEALLDPVFITFPTFEATFRTCVSLACGGVTYNADGDAGDVYVSANNVLFEEGGRITARSDTRGDAGTIRLEVSNSIVFSGIEESGERSGLSSTAEKTGNPGVIEIFSPSASLLMEDQAAIVIQNSAQSLPSSTPGRIDIQVASLDMSGDSRIDSSTRGAGPGGNIVIRADESVKLRGRTDSNEFTGITTLSQPGSTGTAGSIRVETALLELSNGAEIAARPVGPGAFGDAGSLDFDVSNRIALRDASISTESENAAGGNITAFFGHTLELEDSSISASVTTGPSGGGNVTILSDPGSSIVLANGQILAQADAGQGGNILIETSLLLQDSSSLISASSARGIDGTVVTRAPDGNTIDLSPDIDVPPLDATVLLDEPCAARRPGGANSLVVAQREGVPLNVEAVLPAFLPSDVYARLGEPEAPPTLEAEPVALASLTGSQRFVSGRSARCLD